MFHTVSFAQGSMTVDIGSQSRVQYKLWIFRGYATQGMHDAITLRNYAIIKTCRAFYIYFEQVLFLKSCLPWSNIVLVPYCFGLVRYCVVRRDDFA